MSATIISCDKAFVILQVTIEFSNSMLDFEEAILEAVNEVGTLATGEALKQFYINGSLIQIKKNWTSKGEELACRNKLYTRIIIFRLFGFYRNPDRG